MTHLYVECKNKSKLIETDRRLVVARGRGVENRGNVVKVYTLAGKGK